MRACVSPRGTVRSTPRRISRPSTVTCRSLITSVSGTDSFLLGADRHQPFDRLRVLHGLVGHDVGQGHGVQHVVNSVGYLVPHAAGRAPGLALAGAGHVT